MSKNKKFRFLGDMAYFSHSKSLYDTKEEKLVYKYIKNHFDGNVICPNKHLGELTYKGDYAKIASKADYVFVWGDSNHSELTRGCYEEVETAMHEGAKVILIEVNGGDVYLRNIVSLEMYDKPNHFEYGWVESVSIEL